MHLKSPILIPVSNIIVELFKYSFIILLGIQQLPYLLLRTVHNAASVHIFETKLTLDGGIITFSWPIDEVPIYFNDIRYQIFVRPQGVWKHHIPNDWLRRDGYRVCQNAAERQYLYYLCVRACVRVCIL